MNLGLEVKINANKEGSRDVLALLIRGTLQELACRHIVMIKIMKSRRLTRRSREGSGGGQRDRELAVLRGAESTNTCQIGRAENASVDRKIESYRGGDVC